MTMTPLSELQDAVAAGTAGAIARAVVAVAAIRSHDVASAPDADLARLLLELRAEARLIQLEIDDRAADRQRAAAAGKAVKS